MLIVCSLPVALPVGECVDQQLELQILAVPFAHGYQYRDVLLSGSNFYKRK